VCAAGSVSARGLDATQNAQLTWAVQSAPFGVEVLTGSHRVTELGGAAPLSYVTKSGREYQLTRLVSRHSAHGTTTLTLVGEEPTRTGTLALRVTPAGLRAKLTISPAAGVKAIRFTLAASASAHFLGTGERTSFVDLQRTVQPLKVWNACDSSAPAPFFASTAGFGASVTSAAVGRIAFPGAIDDTSFACDLDTPSCSVGPAAAAVRVCLKTAAATVEVTPGSPLEVVSAYVKRTGLPRAPWLPQFGLMQWRDVVAGPADLLGDIHQLQSLNLPVGWVILDNPWEDGAANGCFGLLRFDPARYPDPAGMIREIHGAGVRFMLWISPELRKQGCPSPPYPDGWLTGDDQTFVRDLTNPLERADFVRRVGALAALGVDGFKGDRGDEVDLEKDTLVGGSGVLLQNAYPLLYAKAVADAMKPYRKQWASLFRSAAPGSAAVLPGFVGEDRQHTWNGLYDAIREAQTAGLAGEAMWGSDIGGYQGGGDVTPELLGRWAQFDALTPIFEVGGAGANATFWQLGSDAVERFRAAATLHYELVPYLFDLAKRASKTGLSPIRPLGLTWPGDGRAWAHDAEFTVGDTLLAAPIITPSLTGAATTTKVYLPAGRWIDFFTGRVFAGGRTITRSSTPSDFPLYVQRGSALAANLRSPAVWADPWRVNDLIRPGRQGWLVAPSVGSIATARTQSATLAAVEPAAGSITVTLHQAAPEQQLLVLTPSRICRVSVNGAPVPHEATAAKLESRPAGWLVEAEPRGGVVVKAHVGRDAQIELRGC
jgi:alpha-glucosidase (family GH31 glycosyl hydrolase)